MVKHILLRSWNSIPFLPLTHRKNQNSKDTPKMGKRGNI